MSYFNNNDHQIFKYFNNKNFKEKINFNIWLKHYEPFLEDIFYDFVYVCENNNIKLFINDNTKLDFYKMLYNTSSGILVDKCEFPYAYGLINDEENNNITQNKEEENNKEKNYFYNQDNYFNKSSNLSINEDDDRFPSRL